MGTGPGGALKLRRRLCAVRPLLLRGRPIITSSRLKPPCKERENEGMLPLDLNLASLVRYVCLLRVPVDEGYKILDRSCRESISHPRLWVHVLA